LFAIRGYVSNPIFTKIDAFFRCSGQNWASPNATDLSSAGYELIGVNYDELQLILDANLATYTTISDFVISSLANIAVLYTSSLGSTFLLTAQEELDVSFRIVRKVTCVAQSLIFQVRN